MYTVSKGPSKLVAKTRRGIPQNYEKFETHRDMYRKTADPDNTEIISLPKPVFQPTKKFSNHMKNGHQIEETLSPQHEEIVKYIHETWNMVIAQNPYDPPSSPESTTSSPSSSSASSAPTTASPSIYYTDAPSPVLRDFKPFDLESWWGRRLYYNITKSL
ncbi:MAPK regulated corepressor interacting protein 2 isoform X1 [Phlebotomus papatasi]|uniref:MAPK regulated corepressor interacting protein 2 isoform X1 n=1 Tax=Phlebotomus papatasi TaxID=29031 RepID=UPI0024834A30|nr:MAPK regulated corepressor interacting protein 2 isoform X1 [Phlebotomus papatasi]